MASKDHSLPVTDSTARRYGIAVCFTLIALALWLVLFPVLGDRGELLVFILAVLAASRFGGRGPGFLATAGSIVAVWYFFIPALFSFKVGDLRDVVGLVLLAVSGACISLWIGSGPSPLLTPGSSDRADIAARAPLDSFLRRMGLLAGALLFLVVMVGVLYKDLEREEERQRSIDHAYQVLNASQHVWSTLQDAEAGQRGYLLTGEEPYLEAYRSATAAADAARETVRKLTANNPNQQARLADVDRLVAQRFAALNATIALRRAGRTAEAISVVSSGEGKRIMDEFRAVVAGMQAEENRLVAKRTVEDGLAASRTRWALGLGSGTLLILLVFAGAVLERDFIKRKQAQQALKESEQTTQSLLEAASLAVIGIDAAGQIAIVNATAERMFGYTRTELAGQCLELLLPEDLRERHQAHRADYAADPHTRPMGLGMTLSGRRKDGGIFPVEVGLSTVHTRIGPLAIAFVTDITERQVAGMERERMLQELQVHIGEQRRTEQALRASEEQLQRFNVELEQRVLDRTAQLEASNTELESFAYSVAHDLRAPLRGIDGWSLALLEEPGAQLDDEARHHLGLVRCEAQRMGQLIDGLLRLSQITRAPLKRGRVDLTGMARGIANGLLESHADRRIQFAIQPGLTACGDAPLLEVALTNLLNNAAKFTGKVAEAQIEVGCTEHEGRPAFYVRDNGAGFDMAHAPSLFGPFQRLHRVSEFPGTGIGLATVQRIIHRHGGRIWAEAQVDQGATFYFTLG